MLFHHLGWRVPPLRVVFERFESTKFAGLNIKQSIITVFFTNMELKKSLYESPECNVILVKMESRILSGSDNQLGKPDNYSGSGEGFEW